MIVSITRWSLAHKRLVVLVWLTVTAIGIASAGAATKALSDQYSVPGREGYQTNRAISQTFGTGGDHAPLVPVVTLPAGVAGSPTALAGMSRVTAALQRALPGARVASYASTHNRAFVSRDGRTTFALVYPAARDYSGYGLKSQVLARHMRRCATFASPGRQSGSRASTRCRRQGIARAVSACCWSRCSAADWRCWCSCSCSRRRWRSCHS